VCVCVCVCVFALKREREKPDSPPKHTLQGPFIAHHPTAAADDVSYPLQGRKAKINHIAHEKQRTSSPTTSGPSLCTHSSELPCARGEECVRRRPSSHSHHSSRNMLCDDVQMNHSLHRLLSIIHTARHNRLGAHHQQQQQSQERSSNCCCCHGSRLCEWHTPNTDLCHTTT